MERIKMRGKIGKNPNSKSENQFKKKRKKEIKKCRWKFKKKIYDNFKGENRKMKKMKWNHLLCTKLEERKKNVKKNVGKIAGQVWRKQKWNKKKIRKMSKNSKLGGKIGKIKWLKICDNNNKKLQKKIKIITS